MSLTDALSHSTAMFPCSVDHFGQLRHQLSSKLCEKHPVTVGGSPVLAWRRQHRRNTRSVLPPLDRFGKDNDYSPEQLAWSKQPGKRRHASLPPGVVVCKVPASPSSSLKVLWGGVEQGPPLRPLSSSISSQISRARAGHEQKQISAMALDLKLEVDAPQAEAEVESTCDTSQKAEEQCEEEILLPAPEGPMEEFWFPLAELEAQVRQWHQQEPAPKRALDSNQYEEFFADADDADEIACLEYTPNRVRPGEYLLWDRDDQCEVDLDEEDIASFAAENAVDEGMQMFLMEALILGTQWQNEEEV